MKTNKSELKILGTILALTVAGYVVWVLSLYLLWIWLRANGYFTSYWSMMVALSTAVTATTIVSAGFVAYRELAELTDSRYMEITDRFFQELNSQDDVEARRWIYSNLPIDPTEGLGTLTPEGQAAMKRVLNSLDRVAFLTQAGWIPYELIMPWLHPMIAKSWERLEPYVQYERQRRNEPYYYAHTSKLAEYCKSWRAKNLPEERIKWVDGAL